MSGTDFDRLPGPRRRPVSIAGLKRTIRLGLKSLWLHRLRSLLTVLGIVFGVCSVIAMLAVGEGASHEAQEQIRRLGSNNIILQSVKPAEEQRSTSQRSRVLEYGLTYADLRTIENTVPGIQRIVPTRIIRENVWNEGRKQRIEIIGTLPSFPELRDRTLARGRFFGEEELLTTANVCVIDTDAVNHLFPISDPIGKPVKIGSGYYRVIGVIQPRFDVAQKSGGDRRDPTMYIPLSAARDRFGETLVRRGSGSFEAERIELHEAIIQVASQDDVIETANVIESVLSRRHKKADYDIVVPLALLRQAERTKQIFNVVLGAIAAISLVVGGIGIMNIMLASVTERTREIGIRRALGAKRRDIIVQFLVETVLLSGTGGLIGVTLGVALPFLITIFSGMVTIVTFWSPVLAFSISAMVGVIFGIYPALRAADMDPVEALRHE